MLTLRGNAMLTVELGEGPRPNSVIVLQGWGLDDAMELIKDLVF